MYLSVSSRTPTFARIPIITWLKSPRTTEPFSTTLLSSRRTESRYGDGGDRYSPVGTDRRTANVAAVSEPQIAAVGFQFSALIVPTLATRSSQSPGAEPVSIPGVLAIPSGSGCAR